MCRLSQTFTSSLDLDAELNRLMDEVIAAVRAERGFLLLYTDGVTEALDARYHEFGQERLKAVLRENCATSAEDTAEALDRALTDFIGAAASSDDITFVVVQRI